MSSCLPPENSTLHRAMRYSALGGGKRIRAMLVYTTGEGFHADAEILDIAAAAVELMHAYSLIHDDLPAMDNDNLRHGKPSCHVAFNEAIAILAGDALQSFAFELIAAKKTSTEFSAAKRVAMIAELARAIGSTGMVGGQTLDLEAEGKTLQLNDLENIHQQKTGALITASVILGALASNDLSSENLKNLTAFANCIGLAFQIQDDILDVESSTELLGKTQGADSINEKATYPKLMGLEAAKQKAEKLFQQSFEHLHKVNLQFTELENLVKYIRDRKY